MIVITRSRLTPADLEVPYSDRRNRSECLTVSLHPTQWKRLEFLRREFGVKDREVLVRFFICNGLYVLSRYDHFSVEAVAAIKNDIWNDEMFEQELQQLGTTFYEYIVSGAVAAAKDLVADARRRYSYVPIKYLRFRALQAIGEWEKVIEETERFNGKPNRCGSFVYK